MGLPTELVDLRQQRGPYGVVQADTAAVANAPTGVRGLWLSAEACAFIAAAVGSLILTCGFDLHYWPDVRLYTSGVSLFPSPLGTLLGTAVGLEGLAVVQALCCGLIAGGLVLLRPPFRAVIVATPVLVWCCILGVDVFAAVLFVAGFLLDRGWLRWVSGLVHLSELFLVVATSRLRAAVACVVVGFGLLLTTTYRAGLDGSFAVLPQALAAGAVVALVGISPALVTRSMERAHVLLACGVGTAVVFAVRHDLTDGRRWYWTTTHTLRYALPLVLVALVASAHARRWIGDATANYSAGGSIRCKFPREGRRRVAIPLSERHARDRRVPQT